MIVFWRIMFFGILVLGFNLFVFGQSSRCNDRLRIPVWRVVEKFDSFSADWNCKEKLEVTSFRFGNSRAYVISGSGSGLCGATGNCPTWVVTNVAGQFRIILSQESATRAVGFRYRSTEGFPDLEFRHRMGAGDFYLGHFRFRGVKYRLFSCSYVVYDTYGKRTVTKAGSDYCQ